ncbi:TPA_asm: hypothetical protein vir520_00060 [Caudoviricetes sp. vir520]|nr:TPA_asm: hypothetical protein vir520_00060 [Caudoviricetes sp. vir520]
MVKEKWMQEVSAGIKRRGTEGAFTRQAKAQGMGTQQFARTVMANRESYSPTTVKRANLARQFKKAATRHSPRTTILVCGKVVTLDTGKPAQWPNNISKPSNNARIWPRGGDR